MLIVSVNSTFYETWHSLLITVHSSFIFWLAAGCPKPPEPLNGGVIIPASTGVNSVVRYYCNPGFELIGRSERICESDSTWTGNEPRCEKGGSGRLLNFYPIY